MKIWIACLYTLIANVSFASTFTLESLDWKLKADKRGVTVMMADVPNSPYHAYLATTIIDADIDVLVSIMRDPSTCTAWVYRCGESYVYGNEGPNVDLVHTLSNMPFPVRDREVMARIQWAEDPATRVVTAVGSAVAMENEVGKHRVRIEDATLIWELTPLAGSKTQVRTIGHADPGGGLPVWLINQFSTEIPVKTLTGLRKLALR